MTKACTLVLKEFAPAKINLYLQIVGQRLDGYHLLDSLVAFAGIGDVVTIAPAAGLSLSLSGPFASSLVDNISDNVALKAARLLAKRLDRAPNISITLDKQLPVAAGLGGGSADAAAVLRGLIRLWNVALPPEQLITLSLLLGADVPVCLYGSSAHVSGIGEIVRPVSNLPSVWLVLINMLSPLMTRVVFQVRAASGAAFSNMMPITDMPSDAAGLAQVLAVRHNDLQETALALEPGIGAILESLTRLPNCLLARLSGSGSTCFGLFADNMAACAGIRALAREKPEWWSAAAPVLL